MAGRARRATFINEQAIKTEADLGSQAGPTLFLLHTKYLGWDKGFPDGTLSGAKAHDPSRLLHGALKRSFPPHECGGSHPDRSGCFVADVGLNGMLHQLASALKRQLFFDMSLVSFDGFYAEV